ncbi:MAG: ATP phosphoribosyltransferase regulatory subunit, partial [Myxococcota bacterium]
MSEGPRRRPDHAPLPLAPPAGMRDVLPEEAAERAALAAAVLGTFARYGYRRVITPAFEYAEVLERGLATVGRRDLLRFVEPESGEVALLRPDITPQIARIVATRLGDRPGPWRLAYQGTVLRRTRGRARLDQDCSFCFSGA